MNNRAVAVMTLMAAATLVTAACGSGPSSTGSSSSDAAGSVTSQLVAYTQCMRSHGVPDYPGPTSTGQTTKITSGQQVGVSDSRLAAARGACQHLWPYQGLSQAQSRQELTDALKFARCMRSHGVPKFPDPTTNPDSGIAQFVISASRDGFDPHSPQIAAKVRACEQGLPAGELPGSPEGVEVTTTS